MGQEKRVFFDAGGKVELTGERFARRRVKNAQSFKDRDKWVSSATPCPARKNWANGIPLDGKQDSIQEASASVRPPFGSRRTFFTDHPNRFSRLFSAVGIGSRAEAPTTTLEWLDKAYGIYIHHTPSVLASSRGL